METLVVIATGVVTLILFVGLYSLLRGGDFARNYSNRIMRARVVAQAIAVALVMLTAYLVGRGG